MTVRVGLCGGTANQSWQLAAAMTLVGPDHLSDIVADVSLLEAYQNAPGITPREFALGQLGIVPGRTGGHQEVLCQESLPGSYDPRQNYCLRGYFQRLEFFPNWVREWFRERIPKVAKRPGTLAIHVRRGDYVLNPNANAWHGITPKEYFLMKHAFGAERALIVSDDPEWCETELLPHMPIPASICVGNDPWMDIAEIASCDFHVLSNSTFGHLGALLSNSRGVVYPKNWLTNNKPSPPIFPSFWLAR